MRNVLIAISTLMIAFGAFAQALSDPPAGYTWHKIPSARAAVLRPSGWFVREEGGGGTVAVFLTPEEFVPPQAYETGFSIQIFSENASAPAQLERKLAAIAEQYSVTLNRASAGPFATLSVEYESERPSPAAAIWVFTLAVANTQTLTSYLVVAEGTLGERERVWPLIKPIIDSLALESEH